jgi:hypothetical protein
VLPAIAHPSAGDAAARPDSGYSLPAGAEKLAELRYLIILTSRWESAGNVDAERRARFRADLVRLHREYFAEIDEIAMRCGVQQAMDAQMMVERTVTVPDNIGPSAEPRCDDHGWY